jgi:large conductance mechanosensitive channel
MKKLLYEFKAFISRGNVIDLAIGIIIGSAFSALVNSIVTNLLMPPFGLLLGNVNFQDLFVVLKQGETKLPAGSTLQMARDVGAVTWNYGQFITDVISFILLALGVFFIVKAITKLKAAVAKQAAEEESAEPAEKQCPYCFTNIPIKAVRCPNCTSQLEDSRKP